jgi:hypothetical protein
MVVRGDRAERLYECGFCNHSWRVVVEHSTANDKERSSRKRSKK